MLATPFISRRQLLTGAAALAAFSALPRDARAAATTWDTTSVPTPIFLSNGNLTATIRPKIITIAADISNKKFWVHDSNTGLWNNAVLASQDPSTGTGGYTTSTTLNNGPYYAAMSMASTGSGSAVTTFNFGTLIGVTMPTGFSTYNAAAGTTVTMDTSFNSLTGVSYSNGNLTVTCNSATISTPSSMRATSSIASGKVCWQVILESWGTARWGLCNSSVTNGTNIHNSSSNGWAVGPTSNVYLYNGAGETQQALSGWGQVPNTLFATNKVSSGKAMFEVQVTRPDTIDIGIGVGNASTSTSDRVGKANSWGYVTTPLTTNVYYNNGVGTAADSTGASSYVGIYVDFGNQKLWYYISAAARYNTSGTANPATNTGGIDISGIISSGLYPQIGGADSSSTNVTASAIGVANFAGSFTVPVPSGFTAWDANLGGGARSRGLVLQ